MARDAQNPALRRHGGSDSGRTGPGRRGILVRGAARAVCGFLVLSVASWEAAAQSCAGDCNRNLRVTVDEIVLGVDIALGAAAPARCAAADRAEDGSVSVDDLVAAVRSAVRGCGGAATETPDGTPTAQVPTATPSATAGAQVDITIRGSVFAASSSGGDVSPLSDATIAGTVDRNGDGEIQGPESANTTSGEAGEFELHVSVARGGTVVVGFRADGYAPMYRSVVAEDDAELLLNATLKPVESLACNGPRCSLKGEALSIEGLPDDVSGAARVFNPVTETDAFPGDFSDSDGNLLVSGVFAAVELTDGEGNPVSDLTGEATLRMRLPRDTWGIVRDVEPGNGRIDVPMYAFDEVLGTWVREGQGVLEDGNGTLLGEDVLPDIRNGTRAGVVVARSQVGHFSYWNVDWPVDSHACVSGVITDAEGLAASGATVLVRGVTYTGSSEGVTVGADGRFCVPVMRSEGPGEDVDQDGVPGETQKIRIRVTHRGKLYDIGEFDVPATQGTCGGAGCANLGTLQLTAERELQSVLCPVTGTVRRLDGSPVAGALVVAADETVPEEVESNLCAQTEFGYCDLLGSTDAEGFFRLTTVVMDRLSYTSLVTLNEADSSLFLFVQGSVQGCPSAPLDIVLSEGLRSVVATVQVSDNSISWSPGRFAATWLNVSSGPDPKWSFFSEGAGFSSPVTYGVLPDGTVQLAPVEGGPLPLESGDLVDLFVGGVGEDGYPYWGYGTGVVP